jgi:hypothetical protein
MENTVHMSDRREKESQDWRPWVILGLLAVVITIALFTY